MITASAPAWADRLSHPEWNLSITHCPAFLQTSQSHEYVYRPLCPVWRHRPHISHLHGGPLRALLIEDDPVFAGAMGRAVRGLGEGWQADLATTVAEGIAMLEAAGDDLQLALVDMTLPDGSGLAVIRALRQLRPDVPALVVSTLSSERSVVDAIAEGARGYLHKSDPLHALTGSIAQVLQGHYPISPSLARYLFNLVRPDPTGQTTPQVRLTHRELQTLRCISLGMSYLEVAHDMGVSLSTVQSHIRSLYRKLEVRSQVQAVGKARAQGLL